MIKRMILLTAFAAISMVQAADADLVGYWPLDGNETDASSFSNNGAPLVGGSYVPDTPLGSGLSVDFADVANQRVQVADAPSLDLSSAMTVSAWVNPDAVNIFNMILAKNPSGTAGSNYPGNFEFRINNNGTLALLHQTSTGQTLSQYNSTSPLAAGSWQHVAATLEAGGNVNLYVNGANVGTVATGTFNSTITNNNPLLIGDRADNSNHFDGKIDDVALFNTALSPEQVGVLADASRYRAPLAIDLQQIDVQGVSASSELTVSIFNRVAGNTVDGVGQSTTAPDGTPGNPAGMWLSAGTSDPDPSITFDLGGIYNIDTMVLYNYNEPSNAATIGRGVDDVEIFVSNDDFTSDIRSLGIFSFDQGSGDASNPGQFVDFGGLAAQYVMFDILSNHNGVMYPNPVSPADSGYVGLNEVEFYGSLVPEPQTLALLAFGLLFAPWASRRAIRRSRV